ncbi:hypothetical protein NKH77_20375 [Streptomyces sp. M19]
MRPAGYRPQAAGDRPDTALLADGLMDTAVAERIVAGVERSTGVPFPDGRLVASSFASPRVLWSVIGSVTGGAAGERTGEGAGTWRATAAERAGRRLASPPRFAGRPRSRHHEHVHRLMRWCGIADSIVGQRGFTP